MSIYSIRKATEEDALSLSRICLLTCDAGKSGEHLFHYPELPGLLYAVPYVKLPEFTFGFIMVVNETQEVVGYVVGTSDTREFERVAGKEWWPPLQKEYPTEGPNKIRGKEADERYARSIGNSIAAEECIQFSPAHLHIDILGEHQRKGYGKKLIGRAVEYLRDEVGLNGFWIGMDARNKDAKLFYERLGFQSIPGASAQSLGLVFDTWKG